MPSSISAFGIALAMVLYVSPTGGLMAQACQGCTCDGSTEVHPAAALTDCIKGCSVIQLVCAGRDIVPRTTVIGLGFAG